jgi:hypothetical protein
VSPDLASSSLPFWFLARLAETLKQEDEAATTGISIFIYKFYNLLHYFQPHSLFFAGRPSKSKDKLHQTVGGLTMHDWHILNVKVYIIELFWFKISMGLISFCNFLKGSMCDKKFVLFLQLYKISQFVY